MVVIAISTSKKYLFKNLKALIASARRKENACWGSVHIKIGRTDPSVSVLEQFFRDGMFASIEWVDSKSDLLDSANYAVLVGTKTELTTKAKRKLKHIKTINV
ncbi:MAG: hypothetical protein ACRC6V_03460 [Bacteroidales bacterium]